MFLIVGGTLAYWSWQSAAAQNTAISFTVTSDLACSADGGGGITSNDVKLAPAKCTDTEHAIQRTITTNTTTPLSDEIINMDLWLDINNIDTNLRNSDNFKYAVTTSPDSCTSGVVTAGDAFKNKISSNKAYLFNNKEYIGSQNKTYYLWIWLDEAESNNNTQNKSFNLSLNGECRDTGEQVVKVYADLYGNSSTAFYRNNTYRDKITKVEFVDSKNIPSGATTFDLGTSPSASTDVQGWLVDDGSGNSTYTLKIGANGRIYAKTLQNAFENMTNVTQFDFSNLDTSEATRMDRAFSKCSSVTSLDLSTFDTKNVTNMYNMFGYGSAGPMTHNSTLQTIIFGDKFDTSNVTNMGSMFYGCDALTSLDVTKFNTSRVTLMSSMFCGTRLLTSIDVSSFDTSSVQDMNSMFSWNDKLEKIYVSNKWSTSSVTNGSGIFYYDDKLVGGNGTTYNSSNVDVTYARIDTASTPGYFTLKTN